MSTVHEADVLKISGRGFKVLLSKCLIFRKKNNTIFDISDNHTLNKNLKLFGKALMFLSVYSSCSTGEASVSQEFQSMDPLAVKRKATQLQKERDALQARLEAMEESLSTTGSGNGEDFKEERDHLLSELAELKSKKSSVTITSPVTEGRLRGKARKDLKKKIGDLDLSSPVREINKRLGTEVTPGKPNFLQDLISENSETSLVLSPTKDRPIGPEVDRDTLYMRLYAEELEKLMNEIKTGAKVYIARKESAITVLTRKDSHSPVKGMTIENRFIQDILRIAAIKLNPTMGSLMVQSFNQAATLPTIHQPAPVLDLKKEGARYVGKIKTAIDQESTLYDLVQEYRYEEHMEDSERHAMLLMMLGYNIETAATKFEPTTDATTMIEIGEELRDRFFDTAFLTFIHYMSGNTNKTNVSEIIALTNGGRGQNISEAVLTSLHSSLYEIFYPRRQSGSFTVTRYEFAREAGNASFGMRRRLAHYPVANAVATVASNAITLLDSFFGSCMAPSQNLLTNGDNQGSALSLPGSQLITDGSDRNISEEL